jgi:hypothetical protein
MMRTVFMGLGLLAGTHDSLAQAGWLIDQDSIQQSVLSGSGRSVREVDGGYLLFCGQVSPSGSTFGHCWVRVLDAMGSTVAETEFGSDTTNQNYGYIDPVASMYPAGYVACLTSFYGYQNRHDLYFFSAQGDSVGSSLLWEHQTADSVIITSRSIVQCADLGYLVGGAYDSLNASAVGFVTRTDPQGNILWARSYGMTEILDVELFMDRGYILSGYRLGPQPDGNVTIRTDSLGNVLWTRFSGAQGGFNSAHVVTLDSCIATLTEYRPNSSFDDGYMELTKRGANGNTIWQKRSHYGDTYTYDLELLADGSYICTGAWEGLAVVQKFTPQGDSLWSRYYEWFNSTHQLYDIEPTSDGGFVATGRAWQGGSDPHPGLETIIVLKTDSLGCVVPGCQFVGLEENAMGLEKTLLAYPNPSSGHFTLALTLPATVALAGDLTLQVFDAQGRLVERRNLGRQLEQRIALDLTAQPTGLYSAHLSDGKRILTGVRLVVE